MRKETFPLHAEGIVRGFLRDLDVVRMAFAQARARDADELRLLMQLRNAAAAGITHAGAQAAEHLVDGLGQRPLVRHAALDALGTTKALEMGEVQGAMSGISIGVCGIITVILSLFL